MPLHSYLVRPARSRRLREGYNLMFVENGNSLFENGDISSDVLRCARWHFIDVAVRGVPGSQRVV